MYGILLEGLRHYILSKYGEEAWDSLRRSVDYEDNTFKPTTSYPEFLLPDLVTAAAETFNVTTDDLRFYLGEYFVTYLTGHGYGGMVRILGRNIRDFLDGLDNMHKYLRFTFPCLQSPLFFCANESRTGISLQYTSRRANFTHYVRGIICEIAKQCFDIKMNIEVLNISQEGGLHQVLFRLHFNNVSYERVDDALAVPSTIFFELFPFHLVIARTMKITKAGRGLIYAMPDIVNKKLNEAFILVCPVISFTWEAVMFHTKNIFEILQRTEDYNEEDEQNSGGALRIRGQMKYMSDWDSIVFLGTPILRNVEQMRMCGLFLNDLGLHDFSRDMVFVGEQESTQLKLSLDTMATLTENFEKSQKELAEKTDAMKELMYHSMPRSIAERLKRGQSKEELAKVYEDVTIMSAALNNVCKLSKFAQPQELLEVIKKVMEEIDGLVRTYHCCKFDSTGAAFVVAAGLPTPTELHAPLIAELAFDLVLAVKNINASTPLLAGEVSIQIGCHSGTVLAGVIDTGVSSYQAYGEDIIIAQSLQQEGEPQRILVSEATQAKLAEFEVYELKPRREDGPSKSKAKTFWLEARLAASHSKAVAKFDKKLSKERKRLAEQ